MATKIVAYKLGSLTEEEAKRKGNVLYKAWKHFQAQKKIFEMLEKKA